MRSFKRLPSTLTLLSVLSLSGLGGCSSFAQTRSDEAILEMHQAARKNDRARMVALLPKTRGHTLEPLATYWELRSRLDTASETEVQNFFTR